jgi:WD40 repeat protein/serine/threonine protein kinase
MEFPHSIKGYELQELVGMGGFGAVYRAYQPAVERDVAIKVILPQYANNPDFIRQFEVEAQLVARLEHLHIVALYDFWRDPQGAYLVMRWLRSGNLRDRISTQRLDLSAVAQIIDQIGAALTFAHRNNVVHQDIKPENILIDEEHNAYLTDFGIAKKIQDETGQDLHRKTFGSPAYISPEAVMRESTTPQSDIYSLGIVLYELLTGEMPFTGSTETEIMQKHVIASVPSVSDKQPNLSTDLDQVIWKATAKQPQIRYQTALALAEDFRKAITENIDQKQVLNNMPSIMPNGVNTIQLVPDKTPVFIPSINLEEQLAPANPYKGLRPFEEADADTFFGRESLVEQLLKHIRENCFLALVGPSGSGKSSVIKAGVIPAIRRGAIKGAESEQWFIATMVPGPHPIQELTEALLSIATDNSSVAFDPEFEDENSLSRISQQLYEDTHTNVLLFIDQFEEAFTLVENESERRYFLNNIADAVNNPDSKLWVILTLRADLYDRPLMVADIGQLMRQFTEVILPLSPSELEHAIINPAEKAGVTLDRDLVVQILADVIEQPGALPLLQYTLTELFEKRTSDTIPLEDYLSTGGISGTLASRANEIYQGLETAEQSLARQILLNLISVNEGTESTRRRIQQQELLTLHQDKDAVHRILDVFNRNRILTFDREPVTRAPTVELAHEALIREWENLRKWIDDSRDMLRTHRQLSAATQEWKKSDRDTSFLVSGSRLAQFEPLLTATDFPLNNEDRIFILASVAMRRRFVHRIQLVIAALVILTLIALGFGVLALDRQNEAEEQQNEAISERDRANEQAKISRSRELSVNALINVDELDLSLLLGLEALNTADTFEARNALLTGLFTDTRLHRFLHGHQDLVRSLAYSTNGNYIVSGSADGTVILWDALKGSMVITPMNGHSGAVNAVVFSLDDTLVASAGDDGVIRLWEIPNGRLIREISAHADSIWTLSVSPNGRIIASGGTDGTIRLWDIASGEPIGDPFSEESEDETIEPTIIHSLAFNADGRFLASGGEDNLVRLWDVETNELLATLTGHQNWVLSLAFNADGSRLASVGVEPTLIVWNLRTGQPELTINTGHTNWVRDIAFSPDDSLIATASVDRSIRFWDATNGESAFIPMVAQDQVWSIAFDSEGKILISGSGENILRWSLESTTHVITTSHQNNVNDFALSPDGKLLATVSGGASGTPDNTLRLWNQVGEQVGLIDAHRGPVTSISFSTTQTLLVTTSADQTAVIWDYTSLDNMTVVHVLRHDALVWRAVFSPDGTTIATGTENGVLMLWDVATGNLLGEPINAHEGDVFALAFSPDGTLLASGGSDNIIHLWNVENVTLKSTYSDHTAPITQLVFSPDGNTLASASRDNTIRLWDVENETSRVLSGHTNWVYDLAFNPDGTLLASSSRDETIILWDLVTNQPLGISIKGHGAWVIGVAFAEDGRSLMSVDINGRILFWDIDMSIWRQRACEVANRNFTQEEWVQFFPSSPFHETCSFE